MTNNLARGVDVDESTQTKVCRKCGTAKALSEFGKLGDGLNPRCKKCRSADALARRNADPEADRERCRSYRAANAERIREAQRARRERDAEKISAQRKARYVARAELERAARRQRYEQDPAKFLAASKKWRQENPERAAEYVARYRERNPAIRTLGNQNRRARIGGRKVTLAEIETLATDVCALCGDGLDLALEWPHPLSRSLDHITPLAQGGLHEIANLQWAHLACNMRKGPRTF